MRMLERTEQPSQEQLCRECFEVQPDLNCRYREVLAEIVEEVNAPLTIKQLLAENAEGYRERGLNASKEVKDAYDIATTMGCPNLTTTELPNIPGL